MSQKHIKKLTSRTWLLYYGYMRINGSIVFFICTMAAILTTMVTYLYCDYGNVITLWFWTITFIIAINDFLIIVFYVSFCFYIPITLLNFRFDELIDKLRVSIRWNNNNAIHRIIENYNDLISDCKQLSGTYKVSK